MKVKHRSLLFILVICILATLSALLAANNFEQQALWITLFVLILGIFLARDITGNYSNILVLFMCFYLLYSIAGPISAIYGEGLSKLFTKPYKTAFFLVNLNISILGLWLGITTLALIAKSKNVKECIKVKTRQLFVIAIFFTCVASLTELINLIRIGGLDILFTGKATYQSLSSALTLTLPSDDLALMSCCILTLVISHTKRVEARKIITFLLTLGPYLLTQLILGKRGVLLSLIIVLIVGITWYRPIKKIKLKLLLSVFVIYIFLVLLYSARALMPLLYAGETQQFYERAFERERIVSALIPGNNEFGAAFGNFSEYVTPSYKTFYFGETYFRGMTITIPSWLYPAEKPQSITYEFRDHFFPSEASRGAIAGTGFSGLLEAYMNFGLFGPLFVYFLIGFLLIYLEIKRTQNTSQYFWCFYLFIMPNLAQSFHRSEFGNSVFSTIIRATVFIALIYIFNIGFTILEREKTNSDILNNEELTEGTSTP